MWFLELCLALAVRPEPDPLVTFTYLATAQSICRLGLLADHALRFLQPSRHSIRGSDLQSCQCQPSGFNGRQHTTVKDRTQTMGNKDARPCFLFQDTVDILHQRLFSICVQRRRLRPN